MENGADLGTEPTLRIASAEILITTTVTGETVQQGSWASQTTTNATITTCPQMYTHPHPSNAEALVFIRVLKTVSRRVFNHGRHVFDSRTLIHAF